MTPSRSIDQTTGESLTESPTDEQSPRPRHRLRNIALFALVALAWLVFDIITKNYFNTHYAVGEVITDPIMGLFRFRLVHNTGAAWGLFGDSTIALAIMSAIVCVVIVVFLLTISARANIGEVIGLGLVLAGGIGNGIDRFNLGYVVDFIDFTIIDFPVFNIADIGVTCGFVIFMISLLYSWHREDKQGKELRSSAPEVQKGA